MHGAHHLSRTLTALGHDARLMPARYVRPYSKGQKNNYRDAEAIAEAIQRPTMKFVATKTTDQLDLQALHRVRARFVGQRTGIINQIRAFMLERGTRYVAIALANKPASPGRFFTTGAPSSGSRPMKPRPDPLNPRAVLGTVKAWPGHAGARGKAGATANLDGPCARRSSEPAGRDEGTAARHEQRNSGKSGAIDDIDQYP